MPAGLFGGNQQSVNRLYNEPGGPIAAGLAEGLGILAGDPLGLDAGPLTAASRRALAQATAADLAEQQARQQQGPALVSDVGSADP
jgi:hypothetical protein